MKLIYWVLTLLLTGIAPVAANDDRGMLEPMLVLANRGSAEAQYHVGMFYNNGVGGASKDPKIAFTWFLKSVAGKDPLGAYKLGCYYDGQFPGAAPLDPQQALDYKLLSASAGYALAQHDVAVAYYQKADYSQAGKWWKLAAQQGHAAAAYALSTWYFEGRIEPKNLVLSYAHFKISQLLARQHLTANAQAGLSKMAQQMSPDEVQAAEDFVASWRARPTELTLAARNAPTRIRQLLQNPDATSQHQAHMLLNKPA